MKNCCLCLCLDSSLKYTLLIRPKIDDWRKFRWNALGGKVELGETPLGATVREFMENSALITAPNDWIKLGRISKESEFHVWMYALLCPLTLMKSAVEQQPSTEGRLEVFSLANDLFAMRDSLMPNLQMLLELARMKLLASILKTEETTFTSVFTYE